MVSEGLVCKGGPLHVSGRVRQAGPSRENVVNAGSARVSGKRHSKGRSDKTG